MAWHLTLLGLILVAFVSLGYFIVRTKRNLISVMNTMYNNCKIYGDEITSLKNTTKQLKNTIGIVTKDHKMFRSELNSLNNAVETFNNGFTVPASTMPIK